MENDLSNALSLLAVGMTTVFTVLLLVVLIGNALIRLSNVLYGKTVGPTSEISKNEMAALVAAVDFVTEGKGKITQISNIKPKE